MDKSMDKFRTAMGLLVGILIGVANGIGFKNVPVGAVVAACFSALFIFIFNRFPRKK